MLDVWGQFMQSGQVHVKIWKAYTKYTIPTMNRPSSLSFAWILIVRTVLFKHLQDTTTLPHCNGHF